MCCILLSHLNSSKVFFLVKKTKHKMPLFVISYPFDMFPRSGFYIYSKVFMNFLKLITDHVMPSPKVRLLAS